MAYFEVIAAIEEKTKQLLNWDKADCCLKLINSSLDSHLIKVLINKVNAEL